MCVEQECMVTSLTNFLMRCRFSGSPSSSSLDESVASASVRDILTTLGVICGRVPGLVFESLVRLGLRFVQVWWWVYLIGGRSKLQSIC